jgi:hypothetical protein
MDSVIQFRGTIYENGYGLIASKVMRDKSIPKQSRLIYAYMCSFASIDKDGNRVAFPSVSLQCDELDMSEDTYYKWRKELEKRGLITIEKRKSDGKFERNLYFIEAVPVPQNTNSEPYPKKSGTENSSTENSGTNSISSNSISSNKNTNNSNIIYIDDDKRTNSSAIHNEDSIDLIISNLRESTKDELSERSFKSVVRKVIHKYNQGTISEGKFRDYLHSSVSNHIADLELRRQKDQAKRNMTKKQQKGIQQEQAPNRITVPFYNWLEQ